MKLLRPHQYIKNGFVLIGPLFAHQWSQDILQLTLFAFISFCMVASAVYVLNDLLDIEADKEHPTKKNRPLPSGKISLKTAWITLGLLLTGALTISFNISIWAGSFVSTYFILNIFYSMKLKHVVILDVFIISTGFMLRILVGTLGLGIMPSQWILLCGLMVTLFLGFTKRRAELLTLEAFGANSNITRKVLDDYKPAMLEQFISITAACTILSYGLYTVAPSTKALHGSDNLIYTLPFVVYGIFRYLFLLHQKDKGNDTAKDLLTDIHLLTTVACWAIASLWVIA
ncbi:decaprenyl-phosphate phosphoribosyltransferase [Alteromonas sp. a30]|nr:decaprenyl-phosphate phosphoribosyltransferase [Alteromonas sp. a30]